MTVIPARPTTYNGIEMRSRMEARVAAFLDKLNFAWTYEPRAYASEAGQYLPDFDIHADGRHWFLEVKGAIAPDDAEALRKRMRQTVFPSVPNALIGLCTADDLESGRFAVDFRTLDRWVTAVFVRCPDHPQIASIRLVQCNDRVAPWCPLCDPEEQVIVDVCDVQVVTEATA